MDPITLAYAGAQAGMGIAKAFSGQSDAVRQARAINQQRVQQYRNQLAVRDLRYKTEQAVYGNRLGQYDLQLKENQRAYDTASGDVQLGLNENIRQAQAANLQRSLNLASKQGVAAASGRTGSGLRSDQNIIGQYMQGQGMMMDNLLRARYGAQRQMLGFRNQLNSANRRAFASVANAPIEPLPVPKPIQQAGPGNAGLMLGIGSSLLSGVNTYASNVNAEGGVNLKSFGLK
jgi:hypothetical protein